MPGFCAFVRELCIIIIVRKQNEPPGLEMEGVLIFTESIGMGTPLLGNSSPRFTGQWQWNCTKAKARKGLTYNSDSVSVTVKPLP